MIQPHAIFNINGMITSEDIGISVLDRGYLYGDSLYEVVRSYRGVFVHLEEHLDRLENSARLCSMKLGQSRAVYREQILRTFEAFQKQPDMSRTDVYCRIIVTRGVGRIGFAHSKIQTPSQFTLILMPIEEPSPDQWKQGLHLWIADRLRNDSRALDPAMKSGNYLNSVLAYLETVETQRSLPVDDAVLCNSEGHVTEGTTFNIFYVRRGIVCTPPLEIGILDGITRREVIELARNEKMEVREVRFPRERLLEADEVFVTSSIKEVMAVTRINGIDLKSRQEGPVTRALRLLYRDSVDQRVAKLETGL
jgi:branched-chain amino acid aminotransferase